MKAGLDKVQENGSWSGGKVTATSLFREGSRREGRSEYEWLCVNAVTARGHSKRPLQLQPSRRILHASSLALALFQSQIDRSNIFNEMSGDTL